MKLKIDLLLDFFRVRKNIIGGNLQVKENVYDFSGKLLLEREYPLGEKELIYLAKKKISSISIIPNQFILDLLNDTYLYLFKPSKIDDLKHIKNQLIILEKANQNSQIKRHLIGCEEVRDEMGNIIFEHDDELTLTKLNEIQSHFGEKRLFRYRTSLYQIILYTNFPTTGKLFQERFFFNANLLVAFLTHLKPQKNLPSLSKLNIEKDLFIVDNPKELARTYLENEVKLIVVGDVLTPSFRRGLIDTKKIDPYAQFMLANISDPSKVRPFLLNVELNYNRDLDDLEV